MKDNEEKPLNMDFSDVWIEAFIIHSSNNPVNTISDNKKILSLERIDEPNLKTKRS